MNISRLKNKKITIYRGDFSTKGYKDKVKMDLSSKTKTIWQNKARKQEIRTCQYCTLKVQSLLPTD